MVSPNVISIEVITTDKAGLAKLATDAQSIGRDIETGLGRGIDAAEQKTRQSANRMSSAFKGSVSQMTRELDKLERSAAMSGEGMSAEYAAALAKVRGDLGLVSDEAARTGRGFDEGMSGAMRSIERSIDGLRPKAAQLDKTFDSAAKQIERDLQRIERQAWETGDGMDDAFTGALHGLRADLTRVRTEGARTGAGLESEIGGALKKLREQANALGDSIQQPDVKMPSGGGGGGFLDNLIGDIPKKGAALAGAGAAAGKFIWDGLQAEWAEDRVGGLLAAQTGAASSAAEGLGDRAGDVFADSFGDSVEQVGEAMAAVFENKLIDTSASDAAIENTTKKVITLSQVMGEDFNRVSYSAQQMVRNGIAGSVSEAMDLIGRAQERGLNASEDLLDGITEYSTKFRDLGLNGQQAFGLIEQMMEGGARNTDVAMDALKEFSIRAQDGSKLTSQGFKMIGLDAKTMGEMVASGGDSARKALDMTVDALRAMPPGVERSTAAVDLFGTKAEDLGNALYNMDLDTATDNFEDFGGTIDDMAQKISDAQSGWDILGKQISNASSWVGEMFDFDISDALDEMPELRDRLEEVNQAQQEFDASGSTKSLDALAKKYPELAGAIDGYIKKRREEKDATSESNSVVQTYIDTLQELIDKNTQASGDVIDASEAQIAWNQSVADANELAGKLGGQGLTAAKDGFDLTTQAGRDMAGALNDVADHANTVIESMANTGATTEDIQATVAGARDQFIQLATKMGLSDTAARALADSLNLIPGNYKATLTVEQTAAMANLAAFQRALDRIDRSITVTTYVRGANITGSGGHAFLESGGIAQPRWGAESGGQRHGSTMMNEAGPEVAELPNGTRVLTAGSTRALGEAGMLGGGGGSVHVTLSLAGADRVARALMEEIRVEVSQQHGGSVQAALGARGAA